MRVSNNSAGRVRAGLSLAAFVGLDLVAMGGRRCTRDLFGWFAFDEIR
jgi:hypothetical protein